MNTEQKQATAEKIIGNKITISGDYAVMDLAPFGPTLTMYGLTPDDAISAVYYAARAYFPFQFERAEREIRKTAQGDLLDKLATAENLSEYWSAYTAIGQIASSLNAMGMGEESDKLQLKRSRINRVVGPKIEAQV